MNLIIVTTTVVTFVANFSLSALPFSCGLYIFLQRQSIASINSWGRVRGRENEGKGNDEGGVESGRAMARGRVRAMVGEGNGGREDDCLCEKKRSGIKLCFFHTMDIDFDTSLSIFSQMFF